MGGLDWDEAIWYAVLGALVFLLAYGAGQLFIIWLYGRGL